MQTSSTGQTGRRDGFSKFSTGNADHHRQGSAREPIIFGYEATANDGVRRLFDGTYTRVSVLDETVNTWADIITGAGGPTARWTAAVSQGELIICSGVDGDAIYDHTLGGGAALTIPDLVALGITGAKVVVEFEGFVLLMNYEQPSEGGRVTTRVKWSDLNAPTVWAAGSGLANFQDLDYGDEILAAAPMLGALYIYTRRAIWKMTVNSDPTKVFAFERRYSEPKSQKNCLVYPGSLVSTGSTHIYATRHTFCEYNPYITAPQRLDEGQTDWLHKASGVVFSDPLYKLSGQNCNVPVAEFVPSSEDDKQGEYWFSWTPGAGTLNSLTLVANTQFKTASVVDAGFTAFVNYRQNPLAGKCDERQSFLGASSRDWAWKSIGGVFYREFAVLDVAGAATDLPLVVAYTTEGYNSVVRGLIPLGFTDREKAVKEVLLDQDCQNDAVPCVAVLRIGSSHKLEDPNSLDAKRAPVWKTILPNLSLASPNRATIAQMQAKNLRPGYSPNWDAYRKARYLYFELTIQNADGSPAIGGQSSWSSITFQAMAFQS